MNKEYFEKVYDLSFELTEYNDEYMLEVFNNNNQIASIGFGKYMLNEPGGPLNFNVLFEGIQEKTIKKLFFNNEDYYIGLDHVRVIQEYSGIGLGRFLIETMLKFVSINLPNLCIGLQAHPYDWSTNDPNAKDKLIELYNKFGFKLITTINGKSDSYMIKTIK